MVETRGEYTGCPTPHSSPNWGCRAGQNVHALHPIATHQTPSLTQWQKHKNCYLLRDGEPVFKKGFCLSLSNPHLGPASALAPPPTPYAAPVDNIDMVPPRSLTTSDPAGALAPINTLPCAAPVNNMDMVPPIIMTTSGHVGASAPLSTPPA